MKGRLILLLFGIAVQSLAAGDSAFFDNLDQLEPQEQYRQLSLMLLVSDGVDDTLLEGMARHAGKTETDGGLALNLDDYTTPLIRIVDQQTMLAGSTQLFRFTRENAARIASRLRDLPAENPDTAFEAHRPGISEDAIIIRNAIADSIDFSELSQDGQPGQLSQEYRAHTIYLRNNLEYDLFAAELDRLTQQAIASVGGTTEAYERMFDDEVDSAGLNKKIEAAEYIYNWDREFDRRAARLAEEILGTIWDDESQINN